MPDSSQEFCRHYAVFISYRHADNKKPGRQWAAWLHQALETYEVPADLVGNQNGRGEPIPPSLFPVFRDEEELPADADLTRNIRGALENSRLLVVICSPRAVASRFVADEIRYFKELGKADRILALMIDGEPNVEDNPAGIPQGMDASQECLPVPLRFGAPDGEGRLDWAVRTEPIAADLRPGGRPVQGWTTGAAYREHLLETATLTRQELHSAVKAYELQIELAKLKVVAGALGVPLGVLTKRDRAAQLERARHKGVVLRRWLMALGIFAVLALGAGAFAWMKQREAVAQRRFAISERDAKQRALVARGEALQAAEAARKLSDEQLSRSDFLVASQEIQTGELSHALAHLARALRSNPDNEAAAWRTLSLLSQRDWKLPAASAIQHGEPIANAGFVVRIASSRNRLDRSAFGIPLLPQRSPRSPGWGRSPR